MRKISTTDILVVVGVLFAIAICYSVAHQTGSSDDIGGNADRPFAVTSVSKAMAAPDFTIPSAQGLPINLLAATKTGPVVIDFWAIWCVPCKQELPALDQTYQKYKDRGVQFFGINSDASADKINQFFSKQQLGFPILVDNQAAVNQSYGVQVLPTIFVIDRQGRVRAASEGYDPNTVNDLSTCLDQLLKEQ